MIQTCGTMGGALALVILLPFAVAAQDGSTGPSGPGARLELEVIHDWRASAATANLAAALEARTPYRWLDGEADDVVLVSRIIGGDPPEAALMPLGHQVADLARTGFLLDLTPLALAEDWRGGLADPGLLDACTVDGRVFCLPVTLRAKGWLMVSRPAFARAGIDTPGSWDALLDAADPLRAAGVEPLALERPAALGDMLESLTLAAGGSSDWVAAHRDGDGAAARGAAFARGFEELARARAFALDPEGAPRPGSWADGTPAALMTDDGSWSAGASGDMRCLPGLGNSGPLAVTGDAFLFPNRGDPELARAQLALARLLMEPDIQTGVSNDLGVLPARRGVDLTALHACTRRGLVSLAAGGSVPARDLLLPRGLGDELDALLAAFWADPDMAPADLQERYADILSRGR